MGATAEDAPKEWHQHYNIWVPGYLEQPLYVFSIKFDYLIIIMVKIN
ncbi:hypothetical protein RCG24_06690 [Neobacillus sp. OS1-32]|nr:hypothetical protein [Neobacillus sp. OS1-32]WML31543.1 hypothetical protein RCG24_06690 [Neobacillus sp. OS1-32]